MDSTLVFILIICAILPVFSTQMVRIESCKRVLNRRELQQIYHRKTITYENARNKKQQSYTDKQPSPSSIVGETNAGIVPDTTIIEELLLPNYKWTPKKISIYNIIIQRLWDSILHMNNNPRQVLQLKKYIAKKLDTMTKDIFNDDDNDYHSDDDIVLKRGTGTKLKTCYKESRTNLCAYCQVETFNENRYPSRIVETSCNKTLKKQECLSGEGSCLQHEIPLTILKKTKYCFYVGPTRMDIWKEKNVQYKMHTGCVCIPPKKYVEKFFRIGN